MGGKNAKLKQLKTDTGLSDNELKDVQDLHARLGKEESAGVTRRQFLGLFEQTAAPLAHEVYTVQDPAGRGHLSLESFARALAALKARGITRRGAAGGGRALGTAPPSGPPRGPGARGGYSGGADSAPKKPAAAAPAAGGGGGRTLKGDSGQGRVLGGGDIPRTLSAEEEREQRARIAEERMQAAQRRGMGGSGRPPAAKPQAAAGAGGAPAAAAPDAPAPAASEGGGWACAACTLHNAAEAAECAACGGARPVAASKAPVRTPQGDAALKRLEQGSGGITAEKSAEMAMHREKSDIIGGIREALRRLGEDEPFGLTSMPLDKLRNYRSHLQQRIKEKSGAGGALQRAGSD
eukprot:TRINITY_DN7652_c0_g1_i1.p1 TRINITY_DN7652_c0_g1~~TRINITY_DN7652_c0_g1_i1.p1  ORF type:complete len:351 (+),score=74.14 TRINITY_DN7652_c0_g1_i1:116-1168(+)